MDTHRSPFRSTLHVVIVCGVVTSAVFFAACSTAKNAAYPSLVNNGIVAVSSENPFMGSNIFLAKEMEESNYLYNFLKERGSPQAIEVVGKSEETAEIQLFYSAKQEVYTASPQFDPQLKTKEWIVRGPYGIDRLAYRQVSNLPADNGGVFEIFGRREVLGGEVKTAQTRVIAPAFVPTPKPVVRRAKKPVASKTADTPSWTNPTNFDQQAIAESRGLIPKGSSPPTKGPAVVIGGTKVESPSQASSSSAATITEKKELPSTPDKPTSIGSPAPKEEHSTKH